MRAYREALTVEDPQRLVVEPQFLLRKGQRVDLVLMVEDEAETVSAAVTHEPRGGQIPQRQLLRENGRLVVGALPGDRLVTDTEVRDLLNTME